MSEQTRYRIAYDESDHKFAIPVDKGEEWETWLQSLDEKFSWPPEWAIKIEGDFTFTDPR